MSERVQSSESSGFAPRGIDLVARLELLIAISLSVVVLSFLVIRATHAGALWRDEAATVQLAQMPTISDIASNFQHEAFPVPFPLLLRAYTAVFGGNDGSLRWLGFAVGTALVAAAWFNSRSANGRGPLLFLSLFCLNATFLTWGTSVRGYGIGCVFLILTIGLTSKAIRQPTRGNAAAATIAAIGSVQFMINAIPLVAAVALSAIVALAATKQFRKVGIVCVCSAICALSFVPYLHSYLSADWNIVLKYPTDFGSLWEKLQLALQEHSVFEAILWYAAVPFVVVVAVWKWLTLRRQTSSEATALLFLIAVTCTLDCRLLRVSENPELCNAALVLSSIIVRRCRFGRCRSDDTVARPMVSHRASSRRDPRLMHSPIPGLERRESAAYRHRCSRAQTRTGSRAQ